MKMIKSISVLASALVLAGGISVASADALPAANASVKVAVVNVQNVMQQSPRVAALSKKLEDQFKPRQAKITDEQKSLQDELDTFKNGAASMTAAQRDTAQKKIAADRANLVKEVVAYQQDLQKQQAQITQGILSDLNSVVTNIAKSDSYALVLDSQAVIYAANGTDITADVSKQFDAKQ